jgi:hypothetical protein
MLQDVSFQLLQEMVFKSYGIRTDLMAGPGWPRQGRNGYVVKAAWLATESVL